MTIIEAILLTLVSLGTHLAFHRMGFRKAQKEFFDKGYLEGRKAESNWWIGVEDQANREREKIWREEVS